MTKHDFLNRLRSLHCLDGGDVAFPIDGTFSLHKKVNAFLDNPARFMMRCDDETSDKIWAAIEARQNKENV